MTTRTLDARFQLEMTPDLRDELTRRAKAQGVSRNAYVRQLLTQAITKETA